MFLIPKHMKMPGTAHEYALEKFDTEVGKITPDNILNYCLENLEGTVLVESWGEKGIFYNPGNELKRGVYVLTIKEKNGNNDKGSGLDREGIWRVNLGIRKKTFTDLFGEIPERPPAGGIVDMEYDFTALDIKLPHPVYAWMAWICVLNTSIQTFDELKPYILEAYVYAKEKFKKRKKQTSHLACLFLS